MWKRIGAIEDLEEDMPALLLENEKLLVSLVGEELDKPEDIVKYQCRRKVLYYIVLY